MESTESPTPHRPPFLPPRPLQVVLFLTTIATVTFSGAVLDGAYDAVGSLRSLADPGRLARGLPYAVSVLAILGTHEMGHYLACRRYGIPATLPWFLPGIPPLFGTFGAVIRIRGRIPNRNALFDVAAAGPLAGFVVALPILLTGILTSEPVPEGIELSGGIGLGTPLLVHAVLAVSGRTSEFFAGPVYVAGWFGMLITSMNLFPVGQLDGGHAAYALSRRVHRAVAWTCIVGLVALVVQQTIATGMPSTWTLWCAVLLFLRDRHPPLLDEETPLGPGRRIVLGILLVVFVLAFIPVPLVFFE